VRRALLNGSLVVKVEACAAGRAHHIHDFHVCFLLFTNNQKVYRGRPTSRPLLMAYTSSITIWKDASRFSALARSLILAAWKSFRSWVKGRSPMFKIRTAPSLSRQGSIRPAL